MSQWKVQLTKVALDCLADIRDGNSTAFSRIKKAIDRLQENPEAVGKRLTDPLSRFWRARVGEYRIIYKIENQIITVTIIYVGHRREVYTKIKRMLG